MLCNLHDSIFFTGIVKCPSLSPLSNLDKLGTRNLYLSTCISLLMFVFAWFGFLKLCFLCVCKRKIFVELHCLS